MNLDFSLLANGSLAALHTKQPDYRLAIAEGKLQWLSPHQLEERQAKVSVGGEEAPILVAIDTIAQSVLQSVEKQMPQNQGALNCTLQNLEWINGKLEKHNENLQWRHSIRLFLCNFFRKLIGFKGLDYKTLDLRTIRQAKEDLENASPPPSPRPANPSNPIQDNAQNFLPLEEKEEVLTPTPSLRPPNFQSEQERPDNFNFEAPLLSEIPLSTSTQDVEQLSAEEILLLQEKRLEGKEALQAHIRTLLPQRAWLHFQQNLTNSEWDSLEVLAMFSAASRAHLLVGPCHNLLETYYINRSFLVDQELDVQNLSLSPDQWKIIATLLNRGNQNILQELEHPSVYSVIGPLKGWPTNQPILPTLTALQHTFNQLAYFPDYVPKGISLPLFFIYNKLGPTAWTTQTTQVIYGNVCGFSSYDILLTPEQSPTIRCLISNQPGLQVYNYYTIPNQSPYWWITTTTFECFAPNDVANIERAQRTEVVMLACRGQHHIQQLFNHSSWTDTSNNQNFFRNTSYHNSGTWASPIHPVSSLPESNRLVMALDLVHGVMNLHAKDWLHCDLKPANILLERTWGFDQQLLIRASIGNLGLACLSTESKPRPIQDFESCPIPPEAMDGNAPWTQAADNWSVGILLLQLFYPDYYLKEFGEKSGIELRKALVKWANQQNRLSDRISQEDPIKDVILGLTHSDPKQRFPLGNAADAIYARLHSLDQTWGWTGNETSNWTLLRQMLPRAEPQTLA